MESETEYFVKIKNPSLTNDRKAKIIDYRSIHKYKARKDDKWKKGLVKFMNEPKVTFNDITRWMKTHHWISDNDQFPKKAARKTRGPNKNQTQGQTESENNKKSDQFPKKGARKTERPKKRSQTQPQTVESDKSDNKVEVNAVLEEMMNPGDPSLISPSPVHHQPQEEQQQQEFSFSQQQQQQQQQEEFSTQKPQGPQPAEPRYEDYSQRIRPEFLQSMMSIGNIIRMDPYQSHMIPRLDRMFTCYVNGIKDLIVPDHEKIIQRRGQMKLEHLAANSESGEGEVEDDCEFDHDNSSMNC